MSHKFSLGFRANPNSPAANAETAWIDAEEGKDLDVALVKAQKANSPVLKFPSSTELLAWVMDQRDNYFAAIRLLQKWIRKPSDSAKDHHHPV